MRLLALLALALTMPVQVSSQAPQLPPQLPQQPPKSYLSSLTDLDALLASDANTTLSRQGNLDVISMTDNQEDNGSDNDDIPNSDIPVCRLDYMVGMSMLHPKLKKRFPNNAVLQVEGAAAIALAAQHLNTGDGSVVPEVEGLNERCPIKFHVQAYDSYWNQKLAVDQILDLTKEEQRPRRIPQPQSAQLSSSSDASSDTTKELSTCTVLGNFFSRVTMSTAMITSLRDYLQVGFSTATELEDRQLFATHARLVPTLAKNTQVLIQYLRQELQVKHLGVLHTDTRESQSYSVALQQAAIRYAPDLELLSIDIPDQITPEILSTAVAKLKQTQFTYFLSAVKADHLPALLNETYHQGIAGTGKHTWFMPVGGGYINSLGPQPRDSMLAKTLPGIHIVGLDGFGRHEVYDRLTSALQQLSTSRVDRRYILSKLPTYPGMNTSIYTPIVLKPTFLQERPRSGMTTWAYDSAIAAGLAACKAYTSETTIHVDPNDNTTSISTQYDLSGKDQFLAMTQTQFQGSTGNVSLDGITGTRENARYQIVNVQINETESNETHVAFQLKKTTRYIQGEFLPTEEGPALYNDGTSNIPPDLPVPTVDYNYLSRGMQAGAWAATALIVALAIGGTAWVLHHRRDRAVLSSQPIFLLLVLAGVAVMALSIIPLGIDQGTAATLEGCHVACRTFPWLLSVGFSLTFSALWAKTRRVNKILQNPRAFRRIKVSALDVAKPMVLVLFCNVLVMSLWTALSPLECATQVLVWDEFDRAIETRGYCTSDDALAYLSVAAIVNLGPLVFSLWEAYKARDISTEFAETLYIFKTLILISLVCFMGIPILIIAHDNPSAYFFVLAAIIFVMCLSILLLILGPKIMAFYHIKLCGASRKQSENTLPVRFSRSRRKLNANGQVGSSVYLSSRYSSNASGHLSNSQQYGNQHHGGNSGEGSNTTPPLDSSTRSGALGILILHKPKRTMSAEEACELAAEIDKQAAVEQRPPTPEEEEKEVPAVQGGGGGEQEEEAPPFEKGEEKPEHASSMLMTAGTQLEEEETSSSGDLQWQATVTPMSTEADLRETIRALQRENEGLKRRLVEHQQDKKDPNTRSVSFYDCDV